MRRELARAIRQGRTMKRAYVFTIVGLAIGLSIANAATQTLSTIKSRGILHCGANIGLAGFGIPDRQGTWAGFDVDYCRALAAAIFNDPSKVKFVPTTGQNRFTALQSG